MDEWTHRSVSSPLKPRYEKNKKGPEPVKKNVMVFFDILIDQIISVIVGKVMLGYPTYFLDTPCRWKIQASQKRVEMQKLLAGPGNKQLKLHMTPLVQPFLGEKF